MKVLIADDQPVDRLLMASAVRRLGHTCDVASGGEEAWQFFWSEAPDVVISDWRMPGVDGAELCRRIRAAQSESYTPFIFLTSLADKGHSREGLDLGADDYLPKPLELEDLRARLGVARRLKDYEDQRLELLAREQTARLEMERALDLRDQVLAAVSHDLRSPLAGIFGRVRLLQFRLQTAEVESENLVDELRKIELAASRMQTWLDELADAASLEVGKQLQLQTERLDLVVLAREVIGDARGSSTHTLELDARVSQLCGTWDRRRLERVLSNLISNAVKYSPAGSTVTLTLDRDDTDSSRPVALVQITDEGIGIPAPDLPYVFDRFFRASNAPDQTFGHGIGLHGVRQIVEQHGGSITLESALGRGTTCTVRLPLSLT